MEKRWVAVTTDRNGEFQVAAGTAIESAARDRKDHKETPASVLSPLRPLRSFAAIQAPTSVSVQNPNPWSAWIGITFPLEKLRDLLPN